MTDSHCPYCHGIKSMMLGDIYCSRQHSRSMAEMDTGTLYIRSKTLEETDDHVSRLSIRCMLNGSQHYRVDGNDHLVHADNFLVVNQGQHYRTSFSAREEQDMILVAFRPGLAERIYHSLSSTPEALLDDPLPVKQESIAFFDKTYDRDPVIHNIFASLRQLADAPLNIKKDADLDSLYDALLARLIALQPPLRSEMSRLECVKQSTREELYRRLCIAKDFIDAHAGARIGLEEIAGAACLSVHHFKREFAKAYRITPHRYLSVKRMEKARRLLVQNDMSIAELSRECGYESASSFIRQFRAATGKTPGAYCGHG